MAEVSVIQGYMTDEEGPAHDTFADIYVTFPLGVLFGPIVLNIEADLADDPRNWTLYQIWGGALHGDTTQDIDMPMGSLYDDRDIEYILNLPVTEWKWNV